MPRTLLFDRSDRTRLRVSGAQSGATLNGLVTNDVAALTSGDGMYAAVLTPKGKMIADLRIFRTGDSYLLDTSRQGALGLRDTFAKYVNPRFATVADVTESLCDLGVFGTVAARVVATAAGETTSETFDTLAPYSSRTITCDGVTVTVARVPDLGIDGYELFVPCPDRGRVHDALRAAGATPADEEEWRMLRVAVGRPEWGGDMDQDTLPQEANFDALQGVSYTKGCYVGQETVARIHFRGHVNRTLRHLTFDAVAPGEAPPPVGSALVDASGAVVGEVRSVARLPDGGVFGIGMIRRTVDDGTTLTVRLGGDAALTHTAVARTIGPADGTAVENAKGAIG